MRLHLIGGPGSGKTFLSRVLGKEAGAPVLGLDNIFWDRSAGRYGVKADETFRDTSLREFVTRENWIVEGVYYRWAMASFQRADHIIETWKSFCEMAAWNRAYDVDNLARAITMLETAGLPVQRYAGLEGIRRLVGLAKLQTRSH